MNLVPILRYNSDIGRPLDWLPVLFCGREIVFPDAEVPMQMIEAVIKPHRVDAVKTALAQLGVLGVTAVECKGFGRQLGHTERYRGAKLDIGFVPKVLLKICVRESDVDAVAKAVMEAARTGQIGDGKVFVYPIDDAVRIRTGERQELAL